MSTVAHPDTRWLTVAALIAAILSPGSLYVLCVGENGHCAIELAHPAADCDRDEPNGIPHGRGPAAGDAGTDCTDFALASELRIRPDRDLEHRPADFGPVPLLYTISTERTAATTPDFSVSPDEDPACVQWARSLRTTVLLI